MAEFSARTGGQPPQPARPQRWKDGEACCGQPFLVVAGRSRGKDERPPLAVPLLRHRKLQDMQVGSADRAVMPVLVVVGLEFLEYVKQVGPVPDQGPVKNDPALRVEFASSWNDEAFAIARDFPGTL